MESRICAKLDSKRSSRLLKKVHEISVECQSLIPRFGARRNQAFRTKRNVRQMPISKILILFRYSSRHKNLTADSAAENRPI